MSRTSFPRQQRIADQIQRDLSLLIQRELKDPRLDLITLTEVVVSADYAHARVYVSSLRGPESLQRSLDALRDGAAMLRRRLGRCLYLRTVPRLHFLEDTLPDRAQALTHLIDEAIAADAQRSAS